jgi:hypothetical protein
MSNVLSAVITGGGINIIKDGKTFVAPREHPRWEQIVAAYKEKNFEKVVNLISLTTAINTFGNGKIRVENGSVFYGTEVLNSKVTQHIIRILNDGFDATPMINFLENLMQNPSKQAVDELYDFISAAKISITEDGHLLAYKKVRRNHEDGKLYDIYTGKTSNDVGEIVEMPRNYVNDKRHETCSAGLHFCSQSYLPHFGTGRGDFVVIVKINPKDVVSIPSDYNNAKGRCCRYEVVEMHPAHQYDELFNQAVVSPVDLRNISKEQYDNGYEAGVQAIHYGVDFVDPTNQSDAYREGFYDGYYDYEKDDRFAEVAVPVPVKKAEIDKEKVLQDVYREGYRQGKSDYKHREEYNDSIWEHDIEVKDYKSGDADEYFEIGYNDGFYGKEYNFNEALEEFGVDYFFDYDDCEDEENF